MSKYKQFSEAEDLRIATLIAEGRAIKEIASEMQLEIKSIENRIAKLKRKQGATSTTHMVSMLILQGRISPAYPK